MSAPAVSELKRNKAYLLNLWPRLVQWQCCNLNSSIYLFQDIRHKQRSVKNQRTDTRQPATAALDHDTLRSPSKRSGGRRRQFSDEPLARAGKHTEASYVTEEKELCLQVLK